MKLGDKTPTNNMENEELKGDVSAEEAKNEENVEDSTSSEDSAKADEGANDEASEVEKLKKEVQTLRAQKEHFKKKAGVKASEVKTNASSDDTLTREEVVLIANGMTLEDMDQLKIIQKGSGLNLKEAMETPMFKAYSKEQQAETKRKKASLGASKGTGGGSEIESKPNMTEEEHRALFKKYQNK